MLADLSRYTYRVAIANRSLIALDERSVTFKVKDYRIEGPGRHATMALKVGEFIRSFLTHVLPKGFRRSRRYGLFLSRNRTKTIEVCASSWTWPRLRPSRRATPIQRASVPSQRCPRPPSHGGDGRCAGRKFPARLGIDYPRLKPINPRLVYCGLSGYGDSGPLSEKGGFDQVLQCLSGIAVFQGAAAGTPQVVLGSVLIISPRRCSPMASPQRCTITSTAAKGNI